MKLQRVSLTSLSISTGDCTSCELQQKYVLRFWKFSITSGTFDGILNHTQGRCPTSGLERKTKCMVLSERAARAPRGKFRVLSVVQRYRSEDQELILSSLKWLRCAARAIPCTRLSTPTAWTLEVWNAFGHGAIQHTTLYRLSIRYQYAEMISQWPKSFGTLRYAVESLPSSYIFEVEVKPRVYFGSESEVNCCQGPNRIGTLSDVQQNSSNSYHQNQHMAFNRCHRTFGIFDRSATVFPINPDCGTSSRPWATWMLSTMTQLSRARSTRLVKFSFLLVAILCVRTSWSYISVHMHCNRFTYRPFDVLYFLERIPFVQRYFIFQETTRNMDLPVKPS